MSDFMPTRRRDIDFKAHHQIGFYSYKQNIHQYLFPTTNAAFVWLSLLYHINDLKILQDHTKWATKHYINKTNFNTQLKQHYCCSISFVMLVSSPG